MSKIDYKTAYEDEAKKFQKETLRASKLAKPLAEMANVFISEGHRSNGMRCPRCELVKDAMLALKDTTYYTDLNLAENHP